LPHEFYIRTSGKDRVFTGDYALLIRRHTCATKEEACLLQRGEEPQMATLTGAGSLFGTQDEARFEFDVVGAADSRAYQTVKLAAEPAGSRQFQRLNYKLRLRKNEPVKALP
jgi:hypothetical protein